MDIFLTYLKVFAVGGVVCAIGQILINKTRMTSARVLVTFLLAGAFFEAVGLFRYIEDFGKAGITIPITGFAHSMTSAALDYKNEGPIYGVGSNVFKLAGSVIFYGVVSAWFFGLIRYLWEVLS